MIERLLIRPIVKAPEFTLVIATFAIGLLIKGAISLHFGDSPNTIDGPFGSDPIVAAGLRFNPTSLWIFACTALVTYGVIAFFRCTRLGKAMRAVSVNPEAARLMGIRVDTRVSLVVGDQHRDRRARGPARRAADRHQSRDRPAHPARACSPR